MIQINDEINNDHVNDEINNDDDDFAILNFLALDWLRLNS